MALNEKYSYKTWKRQQFTKLDVAEFAGEIIGAGFSQNEPFTDVFPPTLTGTTFVRCNLDNCNIPAGAVVTRGTNKHICQMNDGNYWIIDTYGNPIEPREKERYLELGLSIDPMDLPPKPLEEPITHTNDPKVVEQRKIDAFLADPEKVKTAALADVLAEGL